MMSDIRMDVGERENEVLDETRVKVRNVFEWLARTADSLEGRDFYGKVTLELHWEAGQLVLWAPTIRQTIR